MLSFWFSQSQREDSSWVRPLVQTFYAVSTASVDVLWQKVANLADVSWHPLIASTNVPNGLNPKPGLIYQAVTRLFPFFSVRIFVERVLPRELLSIRIFALPGIEERVIYRFGSTVCGSQVSYSVNLRGWLSPLVWSIIRPHAARVAAQLAQAAERAEEEMLLPASQRRKCPDLFAGLVVMVGVGSLVWCQMPGAIA